MLKVTTQQLPVPDFVSDDSQTSDVVGTEGNRISSMEANCSPHSYSLFTDSDETPDDLSSSQGTVSPVISPHKARRALMIDSASQSSTESELNAIVVIP